MCKMAANVRVYTTPAPIENPSAGLNYKGIIMVNKYSSYRGAFRAKSESDRDTMRRQLIEEAKAKAAALGANVIVGMRIETMEPQHCIEMVLYGTAGYYNAV